MKNETVEVLVIGAGPSGCVAASYLHNNGVKVKVVEKSQFPRFVIGESLLPRCMDHFEEADLLDCLMAGQFEKKRGARFLRKDDLCTFDFSKKHTPGWDWTWQVPRADFDVTITHELQRRGVDIAFEQEVTDVQFATDGTSVTTIQDKAGNSSSIQASFIIDGSGAGRVLPRLLDLCLPSDMPKNASIFTHVQDINRPEGEEGTLITFDVVRKDTWFWVIPFSNGTTSIGFVGPVDYLASFEGDATSKMEQMLELSDYYYDRFKGVPFSFAPKEVKNYASAVSQLYGNGYALSGNSASFLDPVFSSGVAFALESGITAAKLALKELQGEKVNWQEEYADYILEGVEVFSSYVKEWYTGNLQKIFFHQPENPEIKKQICAVLAGYVWDKTNPFVKNHHRILKTIAHIVDLEQEQAQSR